MRHTKNFCVLIISQVWGLLAFLMLDRRLKFYRNACLFITAFLKVDHTIIAHACYGYVHINWEKRGWQEIIRLQRNCWSSVLLRLSTFREYGALHSSVKREFLHDKSFGSTIGIMVKLNYRGHPIGRFLPRRKSSFFLCITWIPLLFKLT